MPSISIHDPKFDPNQVEIFAVCTKCGGKVDFGSVVNSDRCAGRCLDCDEPADFPGQTADSLSRAILALALDPQAAV
jgi:hypothetical protein